MKKKRVRVIQESESGANQVFQDMETGLEMTRDEFVERIEKGQYSAYHVQTRGNSKIPRSNPDGDKDNNLA